MKPDNCRARTRNGFYPIHGQRHVELRAGHPGAVAHPAAVPDPAQRRPPLLRR
jgi:hypothetical protein